MRCTILFILTFVFLTTTGASIIDKETKTNVFGLNDKLDRLAHEEQTRYGEQARLLREQQEILQRLSQKIELLQRQVAKPSPSPAPPPLSDEKADRLIQEGAEHHAEALDSFRHQKEALDQLRVRLDQLQYQVSLLARPPVATTPATAPRTVPPRQGTSIPPQKSEWGMLLLFFAIGLATFLVFLFLFKGRGTENRLRKLFWRSETEALRDEMIHGRPQIKIQAEGDKTELVNSGEIEAEDLRISIGTSLGSMHHRIKAPHHLKPKEKTMIELPPQPENGPLFVTAEYQNPSNGRSYKDHFTIQSAPSAQDLLFAARSSRKK